MVLSNQWHEPTSPKLPRGDYAMIVGYWDTNIVMLGGGPDGISIGYDQGMQQYDIDNDIFIDNGSYYLPTGVTCDNSGAQCFTQLSNLIFVIQEGQSQFYVYDLATNTLETNWNNIAIPSPATYTGTTCLASDAASNSLFLTGGRYWNDYYDRFEILNISSLQWISAPPSMPQPISSHACIVHSDTQRLYVIGGGIEIYDGRYYDINYKSILYIDISDIQNIQSQNWIPNAQNLTYDGALSARAVTYLDDIFVIGGHWYDVNYEWHQVDRLQIINTISGDVTRGAAFADGIALSDTTAILVQGVIYWFGGNHNIEGFYTDYPWQYYYMYVCDLCIYILYF